MGGLTFFNAENAPEGSAARCSDCSLKDTCPYSAYRLYIERWKKYGSPENGWPFNVLTPEIPLTEELLRKAVETGPYGRCVFRCDNDAVDHQLTQITFRNGVKATLTMTAFTANGGRIIKFCGTEGEILLDEERDVLDLKKFGEEAQPQKEFLHVQDQFGHGGGDYGLVCELYEVLSGRAKPETSLEASVESHLMASRRKNPGLRAADSSRCTRDVLGVKDGKEGYRDLTTAKFCRRFSAFCKRKAQKIKKIAVFSRKKRGKRRGKVVYIIVEKSKVLRRFGKGEGNDGRGLPLGKGAHIRDRRKINRYTYRKNRRRRRAGRGRRSPVLSAPISSGTGTGSFTAIPSSA